ncbi:MAG: aminotransferase class I/II-fold pyridoxal phosphate-dependent enzyme [Myxococcales bacterium]|nr:aminotransferase class I/II-fold pyridoxal phosphate-dependent enzyme [Myxococcales bacterium]
MDVAGLSRRSPHITLRRGCHYALDGRPVVGFCSNDYLGLADEELSAEEDDAPATTAAGAGASRLICGDLEELRDLEAELAALAGTEAALLFPSGFQANVGVPGALLERGDLVFSDRLNHASMIDGLRLSRAEIALLEHGAAPPASPRCNAAGVTWWFTESIFSMEGDRVDVEAARRHVQRGGALYLDEAHSFGLFRGGSTLSCEYGLRPDVLIGTLGKAAGCAGAFVATSATIARFLRSRARSFVFSTGVSPLLARRLRAQIAALAGELGDSRRAALWRNVRHFALLVGVEESRAQSPIFPLLVGDNLQAVAIAEALLDRGWHVQAIRPPTVPAGSARLRLTLSALHTASEIEALAADLRTVFSTYGLDLASATRLGS